MLYLIGLIIKDLTMRQWIGLLSLLIININSVFADGIINEKADGQAAIIFFGIVMIVLIIIILFRRQKRKFND